MATFDNCRHFCQVLATIIVSPCHLVIRSSCYIVMLPSFHPIILSVLEAFQFVRLWICQPVSLSVFQLVSFTACSSWSLELVYLDLLTYISIFFILYILSYVNKYINTKDIAEKSVSFYLEISDKVIGTNWFIIYFIFLELQYFLIYLKLKFKF